jgi:predicted PurR-regulated permease PerM
VPVFQFPTLRKIIPVVLGAAVVAVGCYGALLLHEAFNKHGSPTGNVFLFTLGLSLVVFVPIAFVFGVKITRLESDQEEENK